MLGALVTVTGARYRRRSSLSTICRLPCERSMIGATPRNRVTAKASLIVRAGLRQSTVRQRGDQMRSRRGSSRAAPPAAERVDARNRPGHDEPGNCASGSSAARAGGAGHRKDRSSLHATCESSYRNMRAKRDLSIARSGKPLCPSTNRGVRGCSKRASQRRRYPRKSRTAVSPWPNLSLFPVVHNFVAIILVAGDIRSDQRANSLKLLSQATKAGQHDGRNDEHKDIKSPIAAHLVPPRVRRSLLVSRHHDLDRHA